MKKKFFLLIIAMLLTTSCSKELKMIEDHGEGPGVVDDYIGITYRSKNEIKCEEMKDAKLMSDSMFLTTEDKAFHYGFDKLFSNEQNCKEFDKEIESVWSEPISFTKIVGLSKNVFMDSSFHSLQGEESRNKLRFESLHDYEYISNTTKEWYFTDSSYIVRENGKLYLYDYNRNGEEIDSNIAQDEQIISINDGVVKTNKGYYLFKEKITNKEECEKYDDIDCISKYYIESSELLNNLEDKIYVAFNYNGYDKTVQIYAKNGYIYSLNAD